MKTFLSSLFMLSFILFSFYGMGIDNQVGEQVRSENGQTVNIYCSPELVELTNHWISGFQKSNPNSKIVVPRLQMNLKFLEVRFISLHKFWKLSLPGKWLLGTILLCRFLMQKIL
jgi:hypothetical protein